MGMVDAMDLPVGARLKRWRLYRGMTFKQMSGATGLHVSSLHRMEHGTQEPKHGDLEAIGRALGVSVAEFYAFTPPDVEELYPEPPEFEPSPEIER